MIAVEVDGRAIADDVVSSDDSPAPLLPPEFVLYLFLFIRLLFLLGTDVDVDDDDDGTSDDFGS